MSDSVYPIAGAPISAVPPAPPPAAALLVRPVGYDPRCALPVGYVLDRDEETALFAAWAAAEYQPLTAAEAIAAVGPPLPVPTCLPRLCCTPWSYGEGCAP